MVLIPLGERVLIKRKNIKKTAGGLYLPENSKEAKVNVGEVVSIGEGCSVLCAGDVVTFGRYAPMNYDPKELEFYGIGCSMDEEYEYLIMNEADALCIVAKDTEEADDAA